MKKAVIMLLIAALFAGVFRLLPVRAADFSELSVTSAQSIEGEGCFSIVVGKSASATGELLLGHNEDNGDNVMVQYYVPRMQHKAGELLTFEPECAKIPQVEQTWAYFWSETRASWKASFSDFFVNEWGVAVASDNCSPSREDKPDLVDGGIGYGLRVIIAQRATTAKEGVEIAAKLVDQYGYAASGRTYVIADKDEAWFMEIVKGKHYVAERVPDDEIAVIPNYFTVRSVDLSDTENFVASSDLITYAIQRGWYKPAKQGDYSDFDFALAYQDPKADPTRNDIRSKHAYMAILGHELADPRTFSVKPSRKFGIEDIKKILRSCYSGTADDLSNGYMINPKYTGVRTICASTTMESVIVQFREQPEFTCIWRATLNPDISPYVPWYLGLTKIPVGYSWITPQKGMTTHFNVPVSDLVYNSSRAWWAFQSVQDLSDANYADTIPIITYYRDSLERRWSNNQAAFEAIAYAAFKEDPLKGRQMLTDYTNKQAGLAWLTWRKLFDNILEKIFEDSSLNVGVLSP